MPEDRSVPMNVRVTIGDFSRMTHLSVKALRHYHDLGLLEPAEIDPENGYRSYDADQVPVAQVIRRFRDLGMPLDQIARVINAPHREARSAEIVAHLVNMEHELAETRQTVNSLRALLEGPPLHRPVEFRLIPAARTLAVCERVTADEAAAWWVEVFDELRTVMAKGGMTPTGPSGALYPAEFFQYGEGEVTAFVPTDTSISRKGRVTSAVIPATEAAVMLHCGSLGDVDQTYGALGTEVASRAIGIDAPIREYYVVSFTDTEDETRHRTEICWPVLQTNAGGPSTKAR